MAGILAMRLLNAIARNRLNAAVLESLLADTGRLAEWTALCNQRGQARRMAASSTAMTAVAASTTAMTAVAASSTAMTAVAASTTAMAAVWASNTASDAVLTSSTARLAVYNSNTALAALQAKPTQIARQIGISGRCVLMSSSVNGFIFVQNGIKVILLRRYYSNAEYDFINWARGSTIDGPGNGPVAGAGGRTLYTSLQNRGCVSGTYTDTGAVAANNDTGNFVCAANGLKRNAVNLGGNLYIYYIPV